MANTFITTKMIANRALPHLIEKIQMLGLVQNGVYNEALTHKAGDTIQIRKPTRGVTVDGSGDISGSMQDLKDTSVDLTLDNQRTYPVEVTSKQMLLNVDDFDRQVITPAVSKIAEDINATLLGLYIDIPNFAGASGTTPATLEVIAESRKILQENLAPKNNRSFVFDSAAEAKLLQLDSLVEVDKSGSTSSLRDAIIGRVYDLTMVSDTMVPTHTAGGYTALGDVTITGGAAGATSITMTSAGGSSTAALKKGDLFSIDDYQFVVTADTAAAVSGVVTVAISPALPNAYGDFTSADITFPDVTAGGHVANLMFQKDAFALAMAPLPDVPGADGVTISYGGFSIRVVSDYSFATDKSMWRFDVLYGAVTTMPELALRVLG